MTNNIQDFTNIKCDIFKGKEYIYTHIYILLIIFYISALLLSIFLWLCTVCVHNKCFFYSSELLLLLDVIWLKRGIFYSLVNSYNNILYSVLWIVTLLFLLRFTFPVCVPRLSHLILLMWIINLSKRVFFYTRCHVIYFLFVWMLLIFTPSSYYFVLFYFFFSKISFF